MLTTAQSAQAAEKETNSDDHQRDHQRYFPRMNGPTTAWVKLPTNNHSTTSVAQCVRNPAGVPYGLGVAYTSASTSIATGYAAPHASHATNHTLSDSHQGRS
jgi:hypothetical protein